MISSHQEKDLSYASVAGLRGKEREEQFPQGSILGCRVKLGEVRGGGHGNHKRIHGADAALAGAACGLPVWCSEVVRRTMLSAA